jgi:hypothetical protein
MKAKKSSGKQKKPAVKKAWNAKTGHPDLRTKAGRAWKAREVQKALRAKAIAREAGKAAAALAVSGSWVDLKAHAAKKVAEVQAAAAVCGLVDGVRLSRPLFAEARKSLALDKGEQSTHYEGDACPGGHKNLAFHQPFEYNIPEGANVQNVSAEDFSKLDATGMAWELHPAGPTAEPSVRGAYSRVMV